MKNKKFDFIIKSSRVIKNRFSLDLILNFHYFNGYNDDDTPQDTSEHGIKNFYITFNVYDNTTGLICHSFDDIFKQFKLYQHASKTRMYQFMYKFMIEYGEFLSGHYKINNFFDIKYYDGVHAALFNGGFFPSGGIKNVSDIELNEAGEDFFQKSTFNMISKSTLISTKFNIKWLSSSSLNKLLEGLINNSYYQKIYYFNNKKQHKICNSYIRINIVDICNECIKRELNGNVK